jgi:hypothetical protein
MQVWADVEKRDCRQYVRDFEYLHVSEVPESGGMRLRVVFNHVPALGNLRLKACEPLNIDAAADSNGIG